MRLILKNLHSEDPRCEQPSPARLVGGGWQLHWFALLTAGATLALLGLGGLVTSHGVGMAVPDWPNTYGYNMFFFPISQWVGGIFYEHTHRLLASAVGLLTAILAVWLHGNRARPCLRWIGLALLAAGAATAVAAPARWTDAIVSFLLGSAALVSSRLWPKCPPSAKWLRRLGLVAFLAVVLQGILGGLRVVLFKDQIGIFHATLAQMFFALLCAIALFTSPWWSKTQSAKSKVSGPEWERQGASRGLSYFVAGTTALIFCQLILGATMRHQHAGLAIPDFPLAYGKVWPAMDAGSVAHYNQQRMEITALNPITAFQIILQLAHRLLAMLILAGVGWCGWRAQREYGPKHLFTKLARAWLGLILLQVLLGAATIWSNKAADVATAHVLIGALSLTFGVLESIILFGFSVFASAPEVSISEARVGVGSGFGSRPAPVLGVE